jgi:hypothetical protein
VRAQYYLKDKQKYEGPSPNIYNPDFTKISSKAPSTGLGYGERSPMAKTFTAPGPGTYKSPTSIGDGPTYILGARLGESFEAKRVKDLPSPSHYNPNFKVMANT